MRHPRYCLTHHPGISSNITNSTHFRTPPTSFTLAHRPLFPHRRTTHVTYAGTSPQHAAYAVRASTSPTLACHQRKHSIHARKPPTQAHHPRHPRQHKQHAISQATGYPRGNLVVFTLSFHFFSLFFLGLLKYFHRSL